MPRLREVTVWPDASSRTFDVPGDGPDVDARGLLLLPSLVDLSCEPGFPGFPAREDLSSLCAAARAGGFSDLVLSPALDPIVDTPEQLAQKERSGPGGVRLWSTAAATLGLRGEELSEVGLLQRAGMLALSDGGNPISDSVVLRNVLDYARAFGVTTFCRAADAALETCGVVHESTVSARIGLRGIPGASEEIGLSRVLALVAVTGAPVHLTHLGTARGVTLYRDARARGLPVTASTPARNLLLDENVLLDGTYDSRFRLSPPLRGMADRAALLEAVKEGILWLSADHRPRAPEEKDLEFERAVPGSSGLESAFAAAWTALDGDVEALVRAFCEGPRELLPPGGAPGYILVDPEAAEVVDPRAHRSRSRNDALFGRRLRGAVRATYATASRTP